MSTGAGFVRAETDAGTAFNATVAVPMALRDKIRANIEPLLEPGEQVQQVVVGQKLNGWFGAFGVLLLFWNRYFIVAATDRRIAVFDAGKWTTSKPKALLESLPRATHIGPAQGMWYRCMTLGPKPVYFHARFHKDIAAADAQAPVGPTTGAPLPPPAG